MSVPHCNACPRPDPTSPAEMKLIVWIGIFAAAALGKHTRIYNGNMYIDVLRNYTIFGSALVLAIEVHAHSGGAEVCVCYNL